MKDKVRRVKGDSEEKECEGKGMEGRVKGGSVYGEGASAMSVFYNSVSFPLSRPLPPSMCLCLCPSACLLGSNGRSCVRE